MLLCFFERPAWCYSDEHQCLAGDPPAPPPMWSLPMASTTTTCTIELACLSVWAADMCIDAFVREYKAGPTGGDVRSVRTLDMLHISAFRPGFELSDSAEGLKWKLKLTASESGLFTAEETARGIDKGKPTQRTTHGTWRHPTRHTEGQ